MQSSSVFDITAIMTTQKPFDQLTNLYSLSKTLRLELKPTLETKELLKKTNLQGKTPIQADQEIQEFYQRGMKPLFDELLNDLLLKL